MRDVGEDSSEGLSGLSPGRWEKVYLRSGPGWQEKMPKVLTTHLHATLMPSQLENRQTDRHTHTHTHTRMSFLPKMPLCNSARMEVQAALNYPLFYSPGTAVTCLTLGNSLLKEGHADFTCSLGLGWPWVFRTARNHISTKLSAPSMSFSRSVGQDTKLCRS